MEILPIDLTALVATVMGILIVLIPVAGLTLRYALKPTVDVLGRYLDGKGSEESMQIVEGRLTLLEQQLDAVQSSVDRIAEASEFDASLRRGESPAALSAGGGGENG